MDANTVKIVIENKTTTNSFLLHGSELIFEKENKVMSRNKQILMLVIFLFSLLILAKIINLTFYNNSSIITGKIIGQQRATKGGYTIVYEFKVKGREVKGTIFTSFIKENLTLDSLKNIPNIKIEYSKYSTNFNRIIDKRILK